MRAKLKTKVTFRKLNPALWINSKVTKEPNGHWIWKGAIDGLYGKVNIDGVNHNAHRYVWQVLVGPIPDKLDVCHKCFDSRCVNPEHLYLGTRKENTNDGNRNGTPGNYYGSTHNNVDYATYVKLNRIEKE